MTIPPQVVTFIQVIVALLGAYLTAFWFCLVVWTFRDIQKRSRDVLVQLLATLLVLLFNVPGLLLYIMLRPPETLAEQYARQLEEESLMQDIEGREACPNCKRVIDPDWLLCPSCAEQLRRACAECGRLLDLGWKLCPYCGAQDVAAEPVKPEPGRDRVQPEMIVAEPARTESPLAQRAV